MDESARTSRPEIGPELKAQLDPRIAVWSKEVRQLLPSLPVDLEFNFDNQYLIPDIGTGGFTLSKKRVALSFDPNFQGDKEDQLQNLRASVFHEGYHVVQGFTGEDYQEDMAAIYNAIYEGAATVFERDKAGVAPPWGEYLDDEAMTDWIGEIKALPQGYDWQKYKFYDAETDRQWVMYKVGTYITDKALRNHSELNIEDLAQIDPAGILALADN
jgi:hypothetical protein